MNTWNGLDFLIFLIFAVNTILGMSRGATKEIISMMCLSVALIFTIKFTVPLAALFNSSPLITDVVDSQFVKNFMIAINETPLTADWLQQAFYSISLLICFVGAFSICEGALAFTGFVEVFRFPYAALNRKIGATLGCVRGYVITLVLLVILALHLSTNSSSISDSLVNGSFFARLFHNAAVLFDNLITEQNPEKYREVFRDKDLYKAEDVLKNLRNNQENNGQSLPDQTQTIPAPSQPYQPIQPVLPAAPQNSN